MALYLLQGYLLFDGLHGFELLKRQLSANHYREPGLNGLKILGRAGEMPGLKVLTQRKAKRGIVVNIAGQNRPISEVSTFSPAVSRSASVQCADCHDKKQVLVLRGNGPPDPQCNGQRGDQRRRFGRPEPLAEHVSSHWRRADPGCR
jgi:hypothetical protein